jgi:predicted Zn-ribbon and HTH transcriptional regulator
MKTIRKEIILLLVNKEMNAREISSAVGIGEKEVYTHLSHIARSVKHQRKKLIIKPAECLGCGYVFEKRKRFTRPSRCPICKSEHIRDPMYRIAHKY